MNSSNRYAVSLQRAAPRLIAAVHARVAQGQVSVEFRRYLDQVYAARARGLQLDGQNIFLYQDASDAPGYLEIDFGVGLAAPMQAMDPVRAVALPSGEVATTTHRGTYSGLGDAHAAVRNWCSAHGRTLVGPRWEVYGHSVEGEAPQTHIFYLLQPVPPMP